MANTCENTLVLRGESGHITGFVMDGEHTIADMVYRKGNVIIDVF